MTVLDRVMLLACLVWQHIDGSLHLAAMAAWVHTGSN